eukprot:snap_masked-scaffold_28-processed-gene-2.8-mRNA-1 protein AED:0.48 eAED:0.48 QI:0/-1/0/1/-1/1/1/0/1607
MKNQSSSNPFKQPNGTHKTLQKHTSLLTSALIKQDPSLKPSLTSLLDLNHTTRKNQKTKTQNKRKITPPETYSPEVRKKIKKNSNPDPFSYRHKTAEKLKHEFRAVLSSLISVDRLNLFSIPLNKNQRFSYFLIKKEKEEENRIQKIEEKEIGTLNEEISNKTFNRFKRKTKKRKLSRTSSTQLQTLRSELDFQKELRQESLQKILVSLDTFYSPSPPSSLLSETTRQFYIPNAQRLLTRLSSLVTHHLTFFSFCLDALRKGIQVDENIAGLKTRQGSVSALEISKHDIERYIEFSRAFLDKVTKDVVTFGKKVESEIGKVLVDEQLSYIDTNNFEPALLPWVKTTSVVKYEQLSRYRLALKHCDVFHKLKVQSTGVEDLDLRSDLVEEKICWGIDCWTRKNISLVLEMIGFDSIHINGFIESILLKVLNEQGENGWDICLSLDALLAQVLSKKETLFSQFRVSSRHNSNVEQILEQKMNAQSQTKVLGRNLIGQKIKIFWPLDVLWYDAMVVDYKTPRHLVEYESDGVTEWISLSKHRYILHNNFYPIDPHLTIQQQSTAIEQIRKCRDSWGKHLFPVHPKGIGVVARDDIAKNTSLGTYTGEVYPPWLWHEKEEKEKVTNSFWNIRVETGEKKGEGYDLVYIDAKKKGGFLSRLSHSCNPNCVAKEIIVKGVMCIGFKTIKQVRKGEELTIDYSCVTDSEKEFKDAVCLCGSYICRGSYLLLTNPEEFVQVVNKKQRIGHRIAMLVEASKPVHKKSLVNLGPFGRENGSLVKHGLRIYGSGDGRVQIELVSEEMVDRFVKFGIGRKLIDQLPAWMMRYVGLVLRFIELEQKELGRKLNLEGKDVEVHLKGIRSQRVTNLAIAIDKVKSRLHHRKKAGREISGLDLKYLSKRKYKEGIVKEILEKTVQQVVDDEQIEYTAAEIFQTAEKNAREQKFWQGDRVMVKWCADDYQEYPDWYPATVLRLYRETPIDENIPVLSPVEEVMDDIIITLECFSNATETQYAQVRHGMVLDTANLRVNEISKRYTGPSVHVLYDSGEVDKLPLSSTFVTRPKPNEITPSTGCAMSTSQSPLRVLNSLEIIYVLWTDKQRSVTSRLLTQLKKLLGVKVYLWQFSLQKQTQAPYWWNLHKRKPTVSATPDSSTVLVYPEGIKDIEQYIQTHPSPKSLDETRKNLMHIRYLLTTLHTPKSAFKDVNTEPHSYAHATESIQKCIDVLTFLLHTSTFFTVTEPQSTKSCISGLLAWFDQKETGLDIYSLVGTAFLPHVESCFGKTGDYLERRNDLIKQLSHSEKRFMSWSDEVSKSFDISARQELANSSGGSDAWPPLTLPSKIFGSPVIDAAIIDNSTSLVQSETSKKQRVKSIFDKLIFDLGKFVIKQEKKKFKATVNIALPLLQIEPERPPPGPSILKQFTRVESDSEKRQVSSVLASVVFEVEQKLEKQHVYYMRRIFTSFYEYYNEKYNWDFIQAKQVWYSMTHCQREAWHKVDKHVKQRLDYTLLPGMLVRTNLGEGIVISHLKENIYSVLVRNKKVVFINMCLNQQLTGYFSRLRGLMSSVGPLPVPIYGVNGERKHKVTRRKLELDYAVEQKKKIKEILSQMILFLEGKSA